MSVKKTVLVVDDEPDLRDILQMDLEDAGYRVLLADSGNAAIALLEKEEVDLVVSDMRMANGSGLDILEYVKARNLEKPPLMFITGFSDVELDDVYSLGAAAIVSKPWKLEDLLEKVSRLLTTPALRWKRKSERIATNMTVLIKCRGFPEGISAGLINLGRGGMFVVMDREPPQFGENVQFSFSTPAGATVAGAGAVRWVRKEKSEGLLAGFGLEFLEISDDQLAVLIDLLAELTSRAHIPVT